MFTLTQLILILSVSLSLTTGLFCLIVDVYLKRNAKRHEMYYTAIRDYIEKNEESVAAILDLLSSKQNNLD